MSGARAAAAAAAAAAISSPSTSTTTSSTTTAAGPFPPHFSAFRPVANKISEYFLPHLTAAASAAAAAAAAGSSAASSVSNVSQETGCAEVSTTVDNKEEDEGSQETEIKTGEP